MLNPELLARSFFITVHVQYEHPQLTEDKGRYNRSTFTNYKTRPSDITVLCEGEFRLEYQQGGCSLD